MCLCLPLPICLLLPSAWPDLTLSPLHLFNFRPGHALPPPHRSIAPSRGVEEYTHHLVLGCVLPVDQPTPSGIRTPARLGCDLLRGAAPGSYSLRSQPLKKLTRVICRLGLHYILSNSVLYFHWRRPCRRLCLCLYLRTSDTTHSPVSTCLCILLYLGQPSFEHHPPPAPRRFTRGLGRANLAKMSTTPGGPDDDWHPHVFRMPDWVEAFVSAAVQHPPLLPQCQGCPVCEHVLTYLSPS